MKSILKTISAIAIVLVAFTSCEKDDPKIPNEQELITTLIYKLEPQGGGDEVILSFKDLDGDGGEAPVVTTEPLKANTLYNCTTTLLNELETPAEDITKEVKEEGDKHQFFYTASVNGVLIEYTDKDTNDKPIGITTELRTGDAGEGTFTIILRHEPDKSADGVSDGDISNAGGETDIEVTFNIDVE